MHISRIPSWIRNLYPDYVWRYETEEPVLYLTFDDGPTPDVSEWVLEQLTAFNALGTFFMIGDNVQKYPDLAHQIIDGGHQIGNHTQNHYNGWKTDSKTYLRNVLQGQQTISEYTGIQTELFRPPYAKITQGQARQIQRSHEIIMMDVISLDYLPRLEGEYCAQQVIKHAGPGSIVVFHDSLKAWDRLQVALPEVLAHFALKGYRFEALGEQFIPSEPEELALV